MSNVIPFKPPVDLPEYFEILLIDNFSEKGNPRYWVHPEMEEMFAEMEKEEEFISGPLFRFWMSDNIHVVAIMDGDFYNKVYDWKAGFEAMERGEQGDFWNQEALHMMYDIVTLNLTEDWWSPGGEQFCFSDFGKDIPHTISVDMCSPDVVINRDGDSWGWSS